MRKDESIKWPFKREDLTDNLIEWAGKMKALAEVWGSLSWHVAHYDGDSDSLAGCGEILGMIVADYAGFIEDTVTENKNLFVDPDKNIVFPLARCQEVFDFIGKTRRTQDLCAVDYQLCELTSFIEDAATPAIRLKNAFETLRKEIVEKQKNAPAAVTAAAGA